MTPSDFPRAHVPQAPRFAQEKAQLKEVKARYTSRPPFEVRHKTMHHEVLKAKERRKDIVKQDVSVQAGVSCVVAIVLWLDDVRVGCRNWRAAVNASITKPSPARRH